MADAGVLDERLLYRVGAAAALISALAIPVAVGVYMVSPPPPTALEAFALFAANPLLGLFAFDLMLAFDVVLAVPLYLALYFALRPVNAAATLVITALGLFALAVYFASNTGVELMVLAGKYAAAATEAERALFEAAGEAALATFAGTAFHTQYVVGSLALLGISVLMVWSERFDRVTAFTGIIANTLAFGLYVPGIGIYLSILSVVPFLLAWYLLMAWRLWQLGRADA
jgi:hypothetical protein